MLDIQFIRDNAELVKQKSHQKGYDIDIAKLLELDAKRREAQAWIDQQRANINAASKEFQQKSPSEAERQVIRQTKQTLARKEDELDGYEKDFWPLLKRC